MKIFQFCVIRADFFQFCVIHPIARKARKSALKHERYPRIKIQRTSVPYRAAHRYSFSYLYRIHPGKFPSLWTSTSAPMVSASLSVSYEQVHQLPWCRPRWISCHVTLPHPSFQSEGRTMLACTNLWSLFVLLVMDEWHRSLLEDWRPEAPLPQ